MVSLSSITVAENTPSSHLSYAESKLAPKDWVLLLQEDVCSKIAAACGHDRHNPAYSRSELPGEGALHTMTHWLGQRVDDVLRISFPDMGELHERQGDMAIHYEHMMNDLYESQSNAHAGSANLPAILRYSHYLALVRTLVATMRDNQDAKLMLSFMQTPIGVDDMTKEHLRWAAEDAR